MRSDYTVTLDGKVVPPTEGNELRWKPDKVGRHQHRLEAFIVSHFDEKDTLYRLKRDFEIVVSE